MAKQGNAGKIPISVRADDRRAVLALISASQTLTIEELSRQLPWMQWKYLFSLLGDCIHNGLLTVNQKDLCQIEVKATSPCERCAGNNNVNKGFTAKRKNRKVVN